MKPVMGEMLHWMVTCFHGVLDHPKKDKVGRKINCQYPWGQRCCRVGQRVSLFWFCGCTGWPITHRDEKENSECIQSIKTSCLQGQTPGSSHQETHIQYLCALSVALQQWALGATQERPEIAQQLPSWMCAHCAQNHYIIRSNGRYITSTTVREQWRHQYNRNETNEMPSAVAWTERSLSGLSGIQSPQEHLAGWAISIDTSASVSEANQCKNS